MAIEDKYVKPIKDVIVRDPVNMAPIPEKGMTVPWYGSWIARYWRRRVNDGSVYICEPPSQKKKVELRDENRKRTRKKKEEVENDD
jgi:hypothetical protein